MTTEQLEQSRLYSEQLDIDISTTDDAELFKWFLASVLFGARISEEIAERTYRTFAEYDLLTPTAIVDAGKDFLIDPVMREGGYVRYDDQRSTQVLRNCETLLETYDGSLNELHDQAADSDDLESQLTDFHGVGPVTANIFLRELRPYWEKSDPEPLTAVRDAAAEIGVDLDRYDRESETFARVEAGLIRRAHGADDADTRE